jgi:hypothetical protein
MEVASTKASLVETPDFADSVTATIPRAEFEAALAQAEPAELFLEVKQPATGDTGDVAVAWDRADLERLLAESTGPTVTVAFDRTELEGILADVEAHGLREKALILTVAGAAALGGASAAAAAVHDEAGSTARGITPSYVAVHDEATLAERGIAPVAVAAHDEATLAARGIEAGSLPATHDEATLAQRGVEHLAATHDEATLASRGIEPGSVPAIHDEGTLVTRGIVPDTPAAVGGQDAGFEFPSVDSGTAAAVTGGLAGAALLIVAAGFATRRRVVGHP